MYSNCLFWALNQARQAWRTGCAIWVEKSPRGWWPHFAFRRRGEDWRNFSPVNPRHDKRLPPPIFKGHVKPGKR